MACGYCTDEDGAALLPQYGLGPHKHVGVTDDPASFIGSTVHLPKEEWPDNFVEDAECPGMGTLFCPHCREGL